MFNAAVFWPAFAARGMLNAATVGAATVNVAFRRPGQVLAIGVISTEYEMEYQSADLPTLAEGDAVQIGAEAFKVRAPPLPQGDGYFAIAVLTKR